MSSGSSTQTCPACQGTGGNPVTGGTTPCPACNGQGQLDNRYPTPFDIVFGGMAGSFQVPSGGQTAFPKQIARDFEWELIFMMGQADFPAGLALQLEDLGSEFKFSDYPVAFSSFCGTAQLPFPEGLEPYRFGKKTNLQITAYDVGTIAQPNTVIATGDGTTKAFNGVLIRNGQQFGGPVLPKTVTVTAGAVTGNDTATQGVIAGANISGSINYQNGIVSVAFTTAPTAGTAVTVAWTSGVLINNVEIDMWGHALIEPRGVGATQPPLGS
jgi:hypothetical protein